MTTIWTNRYRHPIDYLLLEDGFYCLLETGYKIILEQTGTADSLWTERQKN